MKGVFKCAREDDERRSRSVKRSSLGIPPCTLNKYSRIIKRLSLGMPHASPSPSTIISSSFVPLYFYHFMRYVLCLERLALFFLAYLVLLAVINKLDPSLHCLERNKLHFTLEHNIGFSCLSLLCV